MRAGIASVLIFTLFLPSQAKMGAAEEDDCCKKVYLFASLSNGDHQSGLMGIYTYQGQHLDKPYYTKTLHQGQEMVFYLTYTDNNTYTDEGWKVSGFLNGSELYIETNSSSEEFSHCPVGLTGASYAGYGQIEHDQTFLIECHNDEVKDACNHCVTLEVNSTLKNPILMGTYRLNGTFNGHPFYSSEKSGFYSFLYYKKDGLIDDGWSIGSQMSQLYSFSYDILTQVREPCPQSVRGGFIYNAESYFFDDSLSISCSEKDEEDDEDQEDEEEEEEESVEKEMQIAASASSSPTAFLSLVLSFFICHVIAAL